MRSMLNHMVIGQKIHEAGEYANGSEAALLDICHDLLEEIKGLEERLEELEPEVQ